MKNKLIIINVKIKKKEDIYDRYNDEIISGDLINYIYEQCNGEKFNNKININIISNLNFSDEEKEKIKLAFKNNFILKKCNYEIQSNYDIIKWSLIFLIGIIFIITSYLIPYNSYNIISEILSIFGWVAIWEVAYNLLFIDIKKKLKKKRIKQLEKSVVNFMQ